MVVPSKTVHQYSMSAASTQVVSEVLSKLLIVGITDPGKIYRLFINPGLNPLPPSDFLYDFDFVYESMSFSQYCTLCNQNIQMLGLT